jgi:CheY-like chemotaxis protein
VAHPLTRLTHGIPTRRPFHPAIHAAPVSPRENMSGAFALNEQTAKSLQKKRVNLYGMHPIFFRRTERARPLATLMTLFIDRRRGKSRDEAVAMSGLELQSLLRAQGRALPIIFITAFPEESVRKRALDAGAICFLIKPFDGPTLIKYLDKALEQDGGS